MAVAVEPLAPEKFPVVCIIEFFNHPVAPRLPNGDENRLDTKVQAQPYDQTGRSRVPVATAKTEFIVKEQKIRRPHRFPASKQTAANLLVLFRTLGFDVDLVAEQIDNIERIKSTISFDVTWPDEVSLVNVVDGERIGKIGVFNALGNVTFFLINPSALSTLLTVLSEGSLLPALVSSHFMADGPI